MDGGFITTFQLSLTYASVVSRETLKTTFASVVHNELDILMSDIGNAYVNADSRDKVCSTARTKFGYRKGDIVMITKALYDLKCSGTIWKAYFAQRTW